MSLNLAAILRESARANPTKSVALFDGGALSSAELDALSDRFAVLKESLKQPCTK